MVVARIRAQNGSDSDCMPGDKLAHSILLFRETLASAATRFNRSPDTEVEVDCSLARKSGCAFPGLLWSCFSALQWMFQPLQRLHCYCLGIGRPRKYWISSTGRFSCFLRGSLWLWPDLPGPTPLYLTQQAVISGKASLW